MKRNKIKGINRIRDTVNKCKDKSDADDKEED